MCFPLFLIIFFLLLFFLLFFFLFRRSISHADSPFQGGAFLMRISLSRGSISHADSLPGGAFLMRIPFPGGSISHADFPSGRSISHADFPFLGEHFSCGFPSGGAFRMRQVRGGEAFIVAKAIVPSSRSSPPGHAAVLRCGMCYFSDGVMDSTVLDIAGCADINNGYAFLIQVKRIFAIRFATCS